MPPGLGKDLEQGPYPAPVPSTGSLPDVTERRAQLVQWVIAWCGLDHVGQGSSGYLNVEFHNMLRWVARIHSGSPHQPPGNKEPRRLMGRPSRDRDSLHCNKVARVIALGPSDETWGNLFHLHRLGESCNANLFCCWQRTVPHSLPGNEPFLAGPVRVGNEP